MKVPRRHEVWQILRHVLRRGGELSGFDTRLKLSRYTKDGTYLDVLVRDGLLTPDGVPLAGDARWPPWLRPQFRCVYRLTDKGREAAEYGEVDVDLDAIRREAQDAAATPATF